MKWNWQQSDWPNFSYDRALLENMEERFLYDSGVLFGTFKQLSDMAAARTSILSVCWVSPGEC